MYLFAVESVLLPLAPRPVHVARYDDLVVDHLGDGVEVGDLWGEISNEPFSDQSECSDV